MPKGAGRPLTCMAADCGSLNRTNHRESTREVMTTLGRDHRVAAVQAKTRREILTPECVACLRRCAAAFFHARCAARETQPAVRARGNFNNRRGGAPETMRLGEQVTDAFTTMKTAALLLAIAAVGVIVFVVVVHGLVEVAAFVMLLLAL